MPSLYSGGSDSKESTCDAGDLGSIPGLGRSPGEGNGYPLPYSFLENPMDRSCSPWRPKELDMTENTFLYSLRISLLYFLHSEIFNPSPSLLFLKNPSPSSLPVWVQSQQGKTSHKMRNSGLGYCYQPQESPAPSNSDSTVSFYNSWLTSAPSTPPHQFLPAAGWQVCQMRPWGWTLPLLNHTSLNYRSPATLSGLSEFILLAGVNCILAPSTECSNSTLPPKTWFMVSLHLSIVVAKFLLKFPQAFLTRWNPCLSISKLYNIHSSSFSS